MNKTSLITGAAGIALLLASAAPAFAEDTSTTSGDASVSVTASTGDSQGDHHGLLGGGTKLHGMASTTFQEKQDERKASSTANHIEKGQDRSGLMIDARIKSLTELKTRLASMKLLPASELATIQTSLDVEIGILNNLKAKIAADTSADVLKTDAESITKANRVYLLVEPKARIAAVASRINAVVIQMTTLGGKLQGRITSAQTAGTDVSLAVTAMSDFNAKIADAKTKADAAMSETANLQVDNGDKTILASNTAALKDARAKLQAAEADLKAAHKDAGTIAGVVKGKGVDAHASASATTN